jgi:hypothetical protein
MPRETNTHPRRALLALGAGAALALAAAPAPPGARSAPAAPVLAPSFFPTWQARNVAFPFVLPGPGGYRLYYAGSGAAQLNESVADQWSTGVALSRDGSTWTPPDDYQPVLRGTRFADGEVVLPARRARFDALSAFGVSVVRDAPARYRMFYTGWNGDDVVGADGRAQPVHFAIGLATSEDGRRWTKQDGAEGGGAVLALDAARPAESLGVGQPYARREGAAVRLWYEAFDGATWRIASARSEDGRTWTREGVVLEPGGPGAPDEAGARNPVVIRRKGRFELWYQGRSARPPFFHVLRAESADGRSWTRLPGAVDLRLRPPLGPEEEVHADSVLVEPDGACRVFLARQTTQRRATAVGPAVSRSFALYAVRVDP